MKNYIVGMLVTCPVRSGMIPRNIMVKIIKLPALHSNHNAAYYYKQLHNLLCYTNELTLPPRGYNKSIIDF